MHSSRQSTFQINLPFTKPWKRALSTPTPLILRLNTGCWLDQTLSKCIHLLVFKK